MNERNQRWALWLVGGMVVGYAVSAACFSLGFVTRQRWLFIAAVLAVAVAIALSTLIRPVLLGFEGWWSNASPWRRTANVVLVMLRAAAVGAVAWAAFTFTPR